MNPLDDSAKASAGGVTRSQLQFSPYREFSREEWAKLRADTPMTLVQRDLEQLSGLIEELSIEEVEQIYLPLSRLLNLHFRSARTLNGVRDEFLGRLVGHRPYVVAIAGSVAVGKSTFARVLRALLARWPDHPRVSLVTTDGFLHPNKVLEERKLMSRKGFPESYDRKRMIRHDGGVVAHPGLYLMGMQFLRRRKSALIDGAGDDARDLSDHLVAYLNGEIARAV